MLPGLWQIFYAWGFSLRADYCPARRFGWPSFISAPDWRVWPWETLALGAFPWAMGFPFGAGQLLAAAVLYCTLERRPWHRAKSNPARSHGPFRVRGPGARLPREGPARDHDVAGHPPAGRCLRRSQGNVHLTDGNLSRHLQVLHEAGFVEIWKGFHKNRPQTLCRITDEGRRRFLEYINVLETVVQDALNASQAIQSLPAIRTSPTAGPQPETTRRRDDVLNPELPVYPQLLLCAQVIRRPQGMVTFPGSSERWQVDAEARGGLNASDSSGRYGHVLRGPRCPGDDRWHRRTAHGDDPRPTRPQRNRPVAARSPGSRRGAKPGRADRLPKTPAVLITAHGISDRERSGSSPRENDSSTPPVRWSTGSTGRARPCRPRAITSW